ncbi:unnamed protein product, partial [Lymnaea stagnalis]
LTSKSASQRNTSNNRCVLPSLQRQDNLNDAPLQKANQNITSDNNLDVHNLEIGIQGLKLSNGKDINLTPVTSLSGAKEESVNKLSRSNSSGMAKCTYAPAPMASREQCFMAGDKGFCHLCNVALTSRQHYMQHTGGKSHQKKVMEAECKAVFNDPNINNPSHPLQNINSYQNDLRSSSHSMGPNGEEYVLNQAGGRCFICGVDFTSPSHATQHLSGQKHKKKSASQTLQGALGLNQSSSLGHSQFPAVLQQSSPFPNQNNSQLVMTDSSAALPPFTPPQGPNGEDFVMRGTRGHCYVCDIELTSR